MEPAMHTSRLFGDSEDQYLAADHSCKIERDTRFEIDPREEHSSEVCHDQEPFTETAPPIESEIWIENVKIEPCSDSDEFVESTVSNDSDKREEHQFITDHICVACPICDKTMDSFDQIRTHFLRIHNRRDAHVICCGKKFTRRKRIVDHFSKQFHEFFTCELCSEKFMAIQALSRHLSVGKGRYTCDECPISFKQKCVFNAHKKCHCTLFRCLVCKEVFDNDDSLSLHMQQQHNSKDRSIICDSSKERVQCHMNSQHRPINYTFYCDICQQWLRNRHSYRRHITDFHGPKKDEKAKCEICQKVYSYRRALLVHKRNVHIEAKHECDICGKRFKRLMSLKEHQIGQTDAKEFQCYFCELKFNNRSCFSIHLNKTHPVEWAGKKPLKSDIDSSIDMIQQNK